MANTASARKRIRQNERRTARNQARKSRMRTFIKKVEKAIASGDKAAAADALQAAQPELQRAATKGVVHAEHGGTEDFAPVGAHQGARRADRRRGRALKRPAPMTNSVNHAQ